MPGLAARARLPGGPAGADRRRQRVARPDPRARPGGGGARRRPRGTPPRPGRRAVIALADADSTVDPGWLRALVPPLADPAVAVAGGRILAPPGASACERFGEQIHDQSQAILVYAPPYVATGNWAARRALFDVLGPFDETLRRGSDVDFSWRAVAAGYRLVFCPDAVVYHQNERHLGGLVREGFQHGFHAVRLRRRHAALIARAAPPPDRSRRWFALAFALGKRVGTGCGTIALLAASALGRSARPPGAAGPTRAPASSGASEASSPRPGPR